ncbi:hypothetical protein BFL34_03052 [Clavibacter michiganensis]|uniref:Uncharacterized protein n=1 Tax=Clavibacter michiganensis TaxID=28447 RepID=A0A251Y109_9MICO|nr:hypothetical protein [Clavibacter michiganensis]OUE18004.1 hypothetical protein BFL34_03052 [Clavibacter michiganensis]
MTHEGAEPPPPDAALRRRLRDDAASTRRLAELRRSAFGRDGSDDDALEELLAEEARLAEEGRRLLAADAASPGTHAADRPPHPRGDRMGDDATRAPTEPTADARDPLAPRRRRILRPGPLAAVLAGALVVAGLGTASASGLLTDDDSWRSQEPTSTPGPPSTPDPRIGVPVPAFTAEPPAAMHADLTDVETVAALRESADGEWQRVVQERPDAVRPDVPVERILAGEEWVRQQAACLGESGVRVQVIGTGDDVRLGTDSADPVVRYVCQVRFPVAPQGPLTDAALGWLHDYYVDFLLPCYASAGEPYEGEVPDRDAFIASSRAGDHWQPYVATRDGMLESRCPSAPAGLR